MIRRGDVVIADFPFVDGGSKKRPALVVQCDLLNINFTNTILPYRFNAFRASTTDAIRCYLDLSVFACLPHSGRASTSRVASLLTS